MLAPVVKASFAVVPGAAAATIAKALQLATQHPPGPVHLDLPVSVAAALEPEVAWADRPRATPMVPANGALAAARAALSRAERPLGIAGLEVLTHDAVPALQGFLAATGVPLITTYKAKGVVAEDQAGVIGAGGLSPKADRVLLPLIADADVIVLIGYDPIEMRAGWRHPFRADQTVIELAGSVADHGMHRADQLFVGDLSAMLTALAVAPATARWPAGQPGAARAALRQAFQPSAAWGPGAAFATLGEALPDDAIVTIDSGAHRILLSQMWQARLPRRVLQSSGFCTMASAVPLAIGAAVGDRVAGRIRPVVAVVGDGGLEMGLGELATLRDCGLPVIVVVLVDGALALIEMKQRALGLARRAVDLGRTDFAAIAEAYGGSGATVATTTDLATALTEALRRTDRFSLIACTLPDRAYDGTF
jgi:acetolactate synthase-1/2/3 large subunit